MKKILTKTLMLFVALATISLTSCTKEPEDNILGKWKANKFVANMTMYGQTLTMDATEGIENFEFLENGQCILVVHEIDEENSEMTPVFLPELIYDTVSYTINDEQLCFIDEGELSTLNIDEMAKNDIILSGSQLIDDEEFPLEIKVNLELERIK